jgi:LacI family transcriptional regulator
MKKVTMQDIADRLGLTKVSVSKALNGQPGISAETRARIVETAARLGYQAKPCAGAHVERRFAMIVPKRFFLETDGFYTEIFYYLNKFCLRDGHQITPIVLNLEEEESCVLPSPLRDAVFDGVFLMGELHDKYLSMLAAHSLNTVAVDFYKKELRTDYILTDNFFLGYSAAQYLIERGHQSIGFVGNIHQTASIADRYFGYLKALILAGLPVREDWRLINNDEDNLYLMDVLLPQELPTAFVCHCDMAGYYMIEALRRAGKRVPEDVSLIAFDNTKLSKLTNPPLTTFDINRKAIAECAYRSLKDKCDGKRESEGRRYVGNSLMERDSVASR